MKKEFSTKWKASKQPRKQRKYVAKAPLHLKGKLLSTHLSKELRTKHKKRNVTLKKGDTVKIMRGKFKGKSGKVTEIKTKLLKVYVDGIMNKKADGSKVKIALRASNLMITDLNLDDKKRAAKLGAEVVKSKKEKKADVKKEVKVEVKKEAKTAPTGVPTSEDEGKKKEEVKKEKSTENIGENKNE